MRLTASKSGKFIFTAEFAETAEKFAISLYLNSISAISAFSAVKYPVFVIRIIPWGGRENRVHPVGD